MNLIDKVCLLFIFVAILFSSTDILAETYTYIVSDETEMIHGVLHGESDSPYLDGAVSFGNETQYVEGWFSGLGLVEVVVDVNGKYEVIELRID